MKFQTTFCQTAILALFVAAALPTRGETAKWINTNNGGNMSVAANWENGYVPQAGDTLDFSVITAQYKGITQDISDDIQFETMTGFDISLNSSTWNFRYLTSPGCEAGGLCFWGPARLNVAGKITYTGAKSFFISDTSPNSPGGVTADEFEYTGPAGKHIFRAPNKTWGGFRARTFTHNGAGHLWLSSYHNSADYTKAHYIVGSGGFTFGDTQANAASRYYYINLDNSWVRTVRIDPYADYSFAANPTRSDNMALSMNSQCALELGTSDYDDPSIPRTVTCIGGIGGYLSGTTADKVNITVDGCGTVVFNSGVYGSRFPGTITVKDTATFVLNDTALTGVGPMVLNAGTTLKAVQTDAERSVQLWGKLTCAADSTLAFDVVRGAKEPALRLFGIALPSTGKVKVAVTGFRGGVAHLMGNIPPGVTADRFELVGAPWPHARLFMRGNRLMLGTDGLVIRIGGGGEEAEPAPKATLLLAGDSTLDEYGRNPSPPFASWGMVLESFMRAGCNVDNRARSGASTQSFISDGRWDSLVASIKPGDFVGIQFGHNDAKVGVAAYADYVRRYVADIRAKGGEPLLMSPISRGTFDDSGNLYEAVSSNGISLALFSETMRNLSVELGTEFVDMHALTYDLLENVGKAKSDSFFATSSRIYQNRDTDFTHPIPAGADAFAALFIKDVKRRGLKVSRLFK